MKGFYKGVGVALLLRLLAVIALRTTPIHVYDGFESPRLSWSRWSRWRFASGAVVPEDAVVRSGHRALAITVHSGDCYEVASDDGEATERAELMESWWDEEPPWLRNAPQPWYGETNSVGPDAAGAVLRALVALIHP